MTVAAAGLSPRRIRLALGGVLLLALVVNSVGTSWGLPAPNKGTWAYDELSPVEAPFEAKMHHGGRYPPLQYWLLGAVYAPVRWSGKAGWLDLSASERRQLLRRIGRAVTVLMSVISLWLLYRLGWLALGRPEPALLATALLALSPTWVYYSKLMNLEVPYALWFLLAALFSLRILERHRLRDYLGFSLAALFAITTKDQAFALFVLPALSFPFLLARRETGRAGIGSAARYLLDRRLLLPTGLALVGFAVIHNLLFDWDGFLHHLWMMTGPETQQFTEHPPTLGGHLAMAWQAVGQIRFVLGTGAALAALVGLFLLARERRAAALWLLLFPVSYYLFFITPIRFHYDRFFLPVAAILALFGGHCLWWLARPGRYLPVRRIVVVALLLIGLARVVVLDAAMLDDSRYAAERWMAEKRAVGETVIGYQVPPARLPRGLQVLSWDPLARHGVKSLVWAGSPDHLILDPAAARAQGTDHLLSLLTDGSYGYELERTFEPVWDVRRLIPSGASTNLATISPELIAARRTAELFLDAQRTGGELWSGQRADWRAVGERFLEALVVPGRLQLDSGVVAYNLYLDGWTMGAERALLAKRNTGSTTVSPRLGISSGERPGPASARVLAPGIDLRLEIMPGDRKLIELPELPPGEVAVVSVGAEDAWTPGGSRELGVRVRLKVPRN